MIPVAITMAPRPTEPDVHDRCFTSMYHAGIIGVHIYAEPGKYLASWPSCALYVHPQRLGEWRNFIFALRTILSEYPSASHVMTCQDDVVWCRGTMDYLNAMLWPSDRCGVVHAYTSRKYACYPRGLVRLSPEHARAMAGACGLVYSREAAELLVSHADTKGWRGHTRDTITDPVKMEGVDTYVGEVLTDAGYEIWVHNPSLGQHIAKDSTLDHGGPFGSRVAANWPGENVDAAEVFACKRCPA